MNASIGAVEACGHKVLGLESHGGKLTAESEYGKGTTMIMWFPKERPILEYEREEQKA